MSAAVKSNGTLALPEWKRPEKTKNELPWADIKTIDLQKFDLPGGKQELAEELRDATQKSLDLASKVLTLFSIILELPDDYFSSRHAYESPSEDHLRYMTYHPRPLEDDARVQNTWSRAHTDFGSLTLLWSQDVAGLQIKTVSGEWRYVPPVDNGIVCNVGDTLDFWSAGYLKSTTHRVVRPPQDQAHLHRQGLFYFVRPGDDVDIKPAPSPLLKRLGLIEDDYKARAPVTGLQYFRMGDLEIEDEAA
ncbi:UPF0676 protein like [Verticillium longisporum]|nr:UPF0676 protein like [Verticillium longisporum]